MFYFDLFVFRWEYCGQWWIEGGLPRVRELESGSPGVDAPWLELDAPATVLHLFCSGLCVKLYFLHISSPGNIDNVVSTGVVFCKYQGSAPSADTQRSSLTSSLPGRRSTIKPGLVLSSVPVPCRFPHEPQGQVRDMVASHTGNQPVQSATTGHQNRWANTKYPHVYLFAEHHTIHCCRWYGKCTKYRQGQSRCINQSFSNSKH